MQRSTISIVLSILSLAGVIMISWLWFSGNKNAVFVNTSELFNEFRMKKTLEADFKKVEQMRKSQLDSMLVVLKMLSSDAGTREKRDFLEYKRDEFARKQQEYGEANEALSTTYNEQIWNQLNQYVKDYGAASGYDFIYGATGDGTLMYASDTKDITREMIRYVNDKYEGIH